MVFIKKLEIYNFKTFAKKTTIPFDKGLNVIMGPNGSGKTNIVDAINFVFGELSVRSLRAANFSQLLWHGNNTFQKARYAIVTVHLDNTERRIPIDSDVVVISRYLSSDGNSLYKVNGKRYPRGILVDMLRHASIGMNVVTQGTILKISDFSPEDRRKHIESIIGIAEYDRKKEEAKAQLREAELNLKAAIGKFEEVKKRLIELEVERNILLRYNYVKNELKRLNAIKLSEKIRKLQLETESINEEVKVREEELRKLREKLGELENLRLSEEEKWKDYAINVVDKGEDKLLLVQKEIGELNSRIAELKTLISSAESVLKSYDETRIKKIETFRSLRRQLSLLNEELKKSKKLKNETEEVIKEKEKERKEILEKIEKIKRFADENLEKLSTLDEKISKLERESGRLEVKINAEKKSCEIFEDQIKSLESRREAFRNLYENFVERFKKLGELKEKEQDLLEKTVKTIEKVRQRIEVIEKEIVNSEKKAKQIRASIAEFASRKDLANMLLSEEKALEYIENLASIKALTGIYGRVKQKVHVDGKYRKAVEAASDGWLQALIVENLDVVKACAEALKKAKIGRIKLLPLQSIQDVKTIQPPKISGILGVLTSFIRSSAKYKPAVNFIFGDTLLAEDENSALKASLQGYRVVTLDGEVFQPGLKFEVGFYREPVDLSDFLPSDNIVKEVTQAISSFEKLIESKKNDLKRLNRELLRLESEKVLHEDAVKFFEKDLSTIRENIERIQRNIVELDRRIRKLKNEYEKSKNWINEAENRKKQILEELHNVRGEASTFKRRLKPEHVTLLESRNAKLEAEINELQRRLNEVNNRILTDELNINNMLLPSITSIKKEIIDLNKNIRKVGRNAEESKEKVRELKEKLKELEKEKEKILAELASKREKQKMFIDVLEEINKQIKTVNSEIEIKLQTVNNLKQELLRKQLELEQYFKELKELGYEEPLNLKEEEFEEKLFEKLRREYDDLAGRVNMNALSLYEPQKNNYKELSIKINQLEAEKREILRFMDEIEREKREAFFDALEKVNAKFSETFHSITGGRGWIQLQNPDEPFSSGLDIIVEFPGKNLMPITAASGGERSIVAICYIFALQSLTKSPSFYIFDEVDAHLDPVNTQRLAELLSKESKNSQIIVISFKEPVAVKADRIFGIYLRDGVSHLYSLPLQRLGK